MSAKEILDSAFCQRFPFFKDSAIWQEMPIKWRALFGKEFLEGLRDIYLRMTPEEKENFYVLQTKEKYGEMRVYCSSYNEEVEKFINIYKELSKEYPLNVQNILV